MTDISYSPNVWSKGQVLTAEKLNNSENALKAVIEKINGKTGSSDNQQSLSDDEALASKQNVYDTIDEMVGNSLARTDTANFIIGSSTTARGVQINGDLDVSGTATIDIINTNGLSVTGAVNINGDLEVSSTATFNTINTNDLSITGNMNITGPFTVSSTTITINSTTIDGDIITNNKITSKSLQINTTSTFAGDITHMTKTQIQTNPTAYYAFPEDNFIGYYKNIQLGYISDPEIIDQHPASQIILRGTTYFNYSNSTTYQAKFNIDNTTELKGTTMIDNLISTTSTIDNLIIGTATTTDNVTTYAGTAIFNTTATTIHGSTTIDNLITTTISTTEDTLGLAINKSAYHNEIPKKILWGASINLAAPTSGGTEIQLSAHKNIFPDDTDIYPSQGGTLTMELTPTQGMIFTQKKNGTIISTKTATLTVDNIDFLQNITPSSLTANGTYTLQITINSNSATYSWVPVT